MSSLEKRPSENKIPPPDLEIIEDRDYPSSKVAIYIRGQAVDFIFHNGGTKRIGPLPSGISENTEIYRAAETLAQKHFGGLKTEKISPPHSLDQKYLTKEK